jgi:HD-GYP domain-containing protein (c-di-GMP phosphodiesterase class II)
MQSVSKTEKPVRLHVDQLCPGVFISLSERWMDHPFLFNDFRISSEEQIEVLRACGIDTVLCYPSRSTAVPRLRVPVQPASVAAPPPDAEELARIEEKRVRTERIARQREKMAQCEKAYGRTAGVIRGVMQRLHSSPLQAAEMAREVVDTAVAAFVGDQDAVLHLIGQKRGEENAYFHALNVMVLSLIMGRAEGLNEAQLQDLGMGALFHDLGKLRVPDAVLKKGSARTRVEEDFYRLHTVYGEQIGKETGVLTPGALSILRHHHERADGSGFPDAVNASKTSAGARIVAIANRYDNLCNGAEGGGMTPAEALSHMFRKEGKWWDAQILSGFIKLLGVYPPGSIVQLSNGAIGLVVAGNRADLLKPSVLIHDAAVPRNEANIVDLIDAPEVKIDQAVRRDAVSPETLEYLAPHHQMIYFYERESN